MKKLKTRKDLNIYNKKKEKQEQWQEGYWIDQQLLEHLKLDSILRITLAIKAIKGDFENDQPSPQEYGIAFFCQ